MFAIPAMAAGTHSTLGVYDLNVESGYTLTPLKADGSAAVAQADMTASRHALRT